MTDPAALGADHVGPDAGGHFAGARIGVSEEEQRKRYLIESGDFTAEELDAAAREVDRGALQLGIAEAFLSHLQSTMSLDDVTGFLGWDEKSARAAVSEQRLYAIDIAGRLRFPSWQFNVGSPHKLIPGLSEVIEVVTSRWEWPSVAGFMATPQSSLVAKGRKTPVEWLRDGGDVSEGRSLSHQIGGEYLTWEIPTVDAPQRANANFLARDRRLRWPKPRVKKPTNWD
jgi:hypothetical protein